MEREDGGTYSLVDSLGHHVFKYGTYSQRGRRIKNPRAANFIWKCGDRRYLYWFHNHGGSVGQALWERGFSPYDNRNPAWLSCGREVDTAHGRSLEWSEPEVILYDDDSFIRISYPDLIEEGGQFFLTETQKEIARVHLLDEATLQALFRTARTARGIEGWCSR